MKKPMALGGLLAGGLTILSVFYYSVFYYMKGVDVQSPPLQENELQSEFSIPELHEPEFHEHELRKSEPPEHQSVIEPLADQEALAEQEAVNEVEHDGFKVQQAFGHTLSLPVSVRLHSKSVFSLQGHYAGYLSVRQLLREGVMPRLDQFVAADLVNYFDYPYEAPDSDRQPLQPLVAIFPAPWDDQVRVLFLGLKAYELALPESDALNDALDGPRLDDPVVAQQARAEVHFNPDVVSAFRLLGHLPMGPEFVDSEVEMLGWDVPSGHEVTVLYELTLNQSTANLINDLRYNQAIDPERVNLSEFGQLHFSYQPPNEVNDTLLKLHIDQGYVFDSIEAAGRQVMFATSVAIFGELLSGGIAVEGYGYEQVQQLAVRALELNQSACRQAFLGLLEKAKSLSSVKPQSLSSED